jgi:threonyl-tRNA synthetase
LDSSTSTIGYKIRQAETQKIPYMAICGKNETEVKKIAVRKHGLGNIGLLTVQELVHNIKQEDKP